MHKKYSFFYIFILFIFFLIPCPASAQVDNPELVKEIKKILYEHYYDPVPIDLMEKTSLEEIFSCLNDPYTKYYTDEEFKNFWISLDGKFGGIGVEIEKKDNKVVVTKVFPNTPAARVNIQTGDIIIKLDNTSLENLPLEEIIDIFRDDPGTHLRLKTFRPASNTYLTYLLTRDYIKINPLEYTILAKNIGYIRIFEFNQDTAEEFTSCYSKLKNQGIKGLILDLRDNPGGLIGSALDISREIIPPGAFVQLLYRGEEQEIISTIGSKNLLPLIVLVNQDSASSSEILAGAVQDRNAGILVGTTTYGKATVQSIIPLVNGGALKFTSGRYLTPKGRHINKIGLKPDINIKDPQQQVLEAVWMLNNQIHRSLTLQLNNKIFLVNGIDKTMPLQPYIYQGNFMVPLRAITEEIGGTVKYISAEKIQIIYQENTIDLKTNSRLFFFNGKAKLLPVAPVLKNQYTFIPIRTFAELFGAQVNWNPATKQVIILP